MGTVTFSIRMDEDIKNELDAFCKAVGMNVSTLFNVCAHAIVNEQRIPFEITTASDPFYSETNQRHLRAAIERLETTGGTVHEQ
ncbi:MAG: type II toxin-antitoxin system RelB/DinJ family antitoxin [Synergistaceae bacterium]|jgi:DNA-damage-inducible protein J|nr:type II toxin-antitoxin system RelB/DinJ family antitoxin [Synergistaceae bacterium]